MIDRQRAQALERILEVLIEAGDGASFIEVVRKIEADGTNKVRVTIDPPLDLDLLTFEQATKPMRFRRPWRHDKVALPSDSTEAGR